MVPSFFLAALLTLPTFGPPASCPADAGSELETVVEDFAVSEDSFPEALMRLATQLEIPMGIEWVKAPAALKPIKLSWRRASMREVLESVVKAVPGYEFDFRGGVVHVHPTDSFTDARNFLNVRLESFEMREEFAFVGQHRLREWLKPIVSSSRPVAPGAGEAGSRATGVGEWPLTFKLEKPTVREVLDRLVYAGEFKIWVVTFSTGPPLTAKGFRRTESLVRGSAVSDHEQPTWGVFKWGEDPIRNEMRSDWKAIRQGAR